MRRLDALLTQLADSGDPIGEDLLIERLEQALYGEPAPPVVPEGPARRPPLSRLRRAAIVVVSFVLTLLLGLLAWPILRGDEQSPAEPSTTTTTVATTTTAVTSTTAVTTTTTGPEVVAPSGWTDLGESFNSSWTAGLMASWDGGYAASAGEPYTLPAGAVYVSADGREWTSLAPNIDGIPASVGVGGTMWMVAGGEVDLSDMAGHGDHLLIVGTVIPEGEASAEDLVLEALVVTSSDGENWVQASPDDLDSRGCWSGPAAVGEQGLVAVGTCLVEDPATGKAAVDPETVDPETGYGDWLQTVRVWTSTDGETWSLAFESPPGHCFAQQAFMAGEAIMVASSCAAAGTTMWVSGDDATWEQIDLAAGRLYGVVEDPPGYLALGGRGDGPVLLRSTDLRQWETGATLVIPDGFLDPWDPPPGITPNVWVERIVSAGGTRFVIGGASVREESTGTDVVIPVVWRSVGDDGWEPIPLDPELFYPTSYGPETQIEGDRIIGVIASDDGFIFVGSRTWLWKP